MDIALNQALLVSASVVFFIGLILWELYFPERVYDSGIKKRSYITNIIILVVNNIVLAVFNITAIYAIVAGREWHNAWDMLPTWLQFFMGIIILDLVLYFWHVLSHRISFLWLLHQAHHSEIYLNATSAIRFHIGELILSLGFKALLLWLTGIPLWIFVV